MRQVTSTDPEQAMIIRMISSLPNMNVSFSFRNSTLSMVELKTKLISLVPKVFEFKAVLESGLGSNKAFKNLFKTMVEVAHSDALSTYQEALGKLDRYMENFGSTPVNSQYADLFRQEGDKHAKAVAIEEFFMDLSEKLSQAIVAVGEARIGLIEDITSVIDKEITVPGESSQLVLSAQRARAEINNTITRIEELRDAMSEYCELQMALNATCVTRF